MGFKEACMMLEIVCSPYGLVGSTNMGWLVQLTFLACDLHYSM